jgi:DNA-binding PadR family transcriptional regulator
LPSAKNDPAVTEIPLLNQRDNMLGSTLPVDPGGQEGRSHSFGANSLQAMLANSIFLQYREQMRKGEYLGNFELMLMLALLRLGEDAYGVTIAQELEEQTGREVVVASVYATLDRLQERGLVASSLGDSTPERGGRAKRYFRITGAGLREVRDARKSLMNLWEGLPQLKGEKA